QIPESIGQIQATDPVVSSETSVNTDTEPGLADKLSVLLIDDNADVVLYLNTLLHEDYKLLVAENGKTGLQMARERIPDLIISDIMMPEMDGYTLCTTLKEDLRTSHIPVIMLTARADHDSKMTGLTAGADAYLAKPFNPEELFIRIEKLVELRKSLQEYYKQIVHSDLPVTQELTSQDKEDRFIMEVRNILLEHLSDESFGIEQLCSNLAVSRSQLYRKFAALTDTTVNQYIISLRLLKAKEMLRSTDLNVSEVAFDTGFKNLSHFSRAFREKFGYPPSRVKV
ncbi:MAG: response regulator, partial [Flavobacteriaceae bacterium]|nr:response regulator [Flavobacteriaceae bacterium]